MSFGNRSGGGERGGGGGGKYNFERVIGYADTAPELS